MKRRDYLADLEARLARLNTDERVEALAYYDEIFEDRGIGDDDEVPADMPAPRQASYEILRDVQVNELRGERLDESGTAYRSRAGNYEEAAGRPDPAGRQNTDRDSARYAEGYSTEGQGYSSGGSAYSDSAGASSESTAKTRSVLLAVILGILALPIALPIALALIGAVLALSVSIVAVVVAGVVAGVAFTAVSIYELILMVTAGTFVLPQFLFYLGVVFLALALILLMISLVQGISRAVRNRLLRSQERRRAKSEAGHYQPGTGRGGRT